MKGLDRRDQMPVIGLRMHVVKRTVLINDVKQAAESDALLVLNVGGVDASSAQQLYARHIYDWRDIRWQHRYRDITSVSPQGRLLLDYTKFHDTVPE